MCYLKFLFQLKVRDKNYSNVKCQIAPRLTSFKKLFPTWDNTSEGGEAVMWKVNRGEILFVVIEMSADGGVIRVGDNQTCLCVTIQLEGGWGDGPAITSHLTLHC